MNKKELKYKKSNVLMIRINNEDKQQFKTTCKQDNINMSFKIESLIKSYIKDKKSNL